MMAMRPDLSIPHDCPADDSATIRPRTRTGTEKAPFRGLSRQLRGTITKRRVYTAILSYYMMPLTFFCLLLRMSTGCYVPH